MQLIIHISASSGARWLADGIIGDGLGQIPPSNGKRKIVVLVPGEDVLITQLAIPPRQRRHLKITLPFLVEDQLAEDLSQLHIVAGDEVTGVTPVAVTRNSRMEGWLAMLDDAGIAPDVIAPDTAIIEAAANDWTLLWEDTRILLFRPDQPGIAADPAMLSSILDACLEGADKEVPLNCYGTGDEMRQNLKAVQRLYPQVNFRIGDQARGVLEVLADNTGPFHGIMPLNLLQGRFRRAGNDLKPLWPAFIKIILFWFCAQMLVDGGQLLYLDHRTAQMKAETVAVYRDFFPQETRIVDPVRQLKAHLSQSSSGNAPELLSLLASLAARWQATGGKLQVQMQSMTYRQPEQKLIIIVSAPTLEAVNDLARQLNGSDLAVIVTSISDEKTGFRGELSIGKVQR